MWRRSSNSTRAGTRPGLRGRIPEAAALFLLPLLLFIGLHAGRLYAFDALRVRFGHAAAEGAAILIEALASLLLGGGLALLLRRRRQAAAQAPAPPSPTAGIPEMRQPPPVAERGLDDFALTLSHEIKAPVRAIDGYTRIFIEDYGSRLDAEALDMLSNVRSICKDTIALINKLMEFTRIADDEPVKEIVNLKELIAAVFREQTALSAESRECRLQFAGSIPPVIGDRFLLTLAMQNILSNALKFTREKETAVITAGCRREDGRSVIYIRDNGAGFDMQFSQKLFGLFQRMHSQDEFEGSGLGLFIVKKIVQKHGGQVWIVSEVEEGTTIYIALDPKDVLDAE